MTKLTPEEIATVLATNPGWRIEGDALVRDLTFASFPQAVAFVNRVADLAEQEGHHPDIAIRYKGVRLDLTTHDEGGVTERDARMIGLLGDGVVV